MAVHPRFSALIVNGAESCEKERFMHDRDSSIKCMRYSHAIMTELLGEDRRAAR